MKLIANQTIKVKGEYVRPDAEIDVDDKDGKALLASGAARRKTREIVDDGENEDGRATNATVSPDPAKVGQPKK